MKTAFFAFSLSSGWFEPSYLLWAGKKFMHMRQTMPKGGGPRRDETLFDRDRVYHRGGLTTQAVQLGGLVLGLFCLYYENGTLSCKACFVCLFSSFSLASYCGTSRVLLRETPRYSQASPDTYVSESARWKEHASRAMRDVKTQYMVWRQQLTAQKSRPR